MIAWHAKAVAERHELDAALRFTRSFLSAPAQERSVVVRDWDAQLEWAQPNPRRLACADEQPGEPIERIRAGLLFHSLSIASFDARDFLVGLAVLHHSGLLAQLDPRALFHQIADAVGGAAAQALMDFQRRADADKSMVAFQLIAVPSAAGGAELRMK